VTAIAGYVASRVRWRGSCSVCVRSTLLFKQDVRQDGSELGGLDLPKDRMRGPPNVRSSKRPNSRKRADAELKKGDMDFLPGRAHNEENQMPKSERGGFDVVRTAAWTADGRCI
jgi:hypothetical protein